MILRLQGYDYVIKYVESEQNISDVISHRPDYKQKLIESAVVHKYVRIVTSTAVPKSFTLEDITTTTKQNKNLQIIKHFSNY